MRRRNKKSESFHEYEAIDSRNCFEVYEGLKLLGTRLVWRTKEVKPDHWYENGDLQDGRRPTFRIVCF